MQIFLMELKEQLIGRALIVLTVLSSLIVVGHRVVGYRGRTTISFDRSMVWA